MDFRECFVKRKTKASEKEQYSHQNLVIFQRPSYRLQL